ncbi:hypothetical protein V6N13_113627 [Hibiscus sabdariffa]
MPPFFSHASYSQFHSPYTPMPPSTEGFFAGAFQPYSSMMTAPYTPTPPPHQMHTSVAPLSVYLPQHPDFGSSYGMVHHTPPGSLFATGPSGSDHHADDESEEDDDEADALVRRNPPGIVVHQIVGPGDIGDISEGRVTRSVKGENRIPCHGRTELAIHGDRSS